MSIFYNGQLLVTPTVASQVYDQGLASQFPGKSNNIPCLLGTSLGGIPKTPIFFDSPVVARRVLRGGDLLRAVELAFAPSAETGSPYRVGVVRVEAAVQSTLTLKDSGGADAMVLKSADYGAHTNGIKISVAAGTSLGKRLTVQEGEDYYVRDNLARTPLTVRYSGTELTATATVTATTLVLKAPSGGAGTTLTLSNYRNVRELCDAIGAVAGFSAIAAIPTLEVATGLDGMVATSCKGVDLAIKADLQACIDWINQQAGSIVSATRATGALNPPAAITAAYLSGGSDGAAPTTDDWQDGFDALQGVDVNFVVPLSSNAAIHDMADAHVMFTSTAGRSERRAFVGGGVTSGTLASAIAAAKSAAMAINSDRTALCFPGLLGYDDSNNLIALPAYFTAAAVAGGFGAINPGNTLTNKVLSIPGTDVVLSAMTDSDDLIEGGVLAVRRTKRGYVVSKAISTWLSNDNYNRVEISTGCALDFVARTVREALEMFVGRKASPITLHEALSTTDSVLRELARPEPIGIGAIVGDEANPAYRDIVAEIQGDVLRVHFECSPAIPVNYVLIGIYAQAYAGTASASVAAL